MTFVVLWNGCRSHRGGRMLFGPESSAIVMADTPVTEGRSQTDQLRAVKSQFPDWFTSAEMVEATGLHTDQISTALTNLQRQGEIQRERKHVMRGRISGVIRQRYKWTR